MQTFEPDQLVLVRENDTQEGRASPPSTSPLLDIFERRAYLTFVLVVRSKIIRTIFTPAGRVSRDTLHYPRRGYSFMEDFHERPRKG